jgi:TolA-binding protein
MWASFGTAASGQRGGKPGDPQQQPQAGEVSSDASTATGGRDELSELKSQLSAMQQKIEKLSQSRP